MDKEKSTQLARPQDLGVLISPPSMRGTPIWLVYILALIGTIYAFNPTAGVLELIPDNIPFIGNLDEGVAFLWIWYGLVEFFEGRKYRRNKPEDDV